VIFRWFDPKNQEISALHFPSNYWKRQPFYSPLIADPALLQPVLKNIFTRINPRKYKKPFFKMTAELLSRK